MAKDTDKNDYYGVIVPKGSALAQWLADMKRETNISEAQAIVFAAAHYVKATGGSLPVASLAQTVQSVAAPVAQPAGISISLNGHGATNNDLDEYGEPD